MLTELRLANLGVIDEASVELGPGFTVVTGETGAGKTMIVSGLGLLTGGRADTKLVRRGAHRALVEGRLAADADLAAAVEDRGGELDGAEVLLSRIVTSSRSRALVGGVQVPVPALTDLVGERITLHGQSEQIRLGSPERQREVVDAFAGPEHLALLAEYRTLWARRRAAATELADLVARAHERAREVALLEFGVREIEKVAPQPGEDADLRAEARRLQIVDDLRLGARLALGALAGDDEAFSDEPTALGLVAVARKALAGLAADDPSLAEVARQVDEASFLLSDASGELASYLASLEADPARLEWISGRLAQLQGLTRRYGDTVEDVLAWSGQATERLANLAGSDDRIDGLRRAIARDDAEIAARAEVLTAARRSAGAELSRRAEGELAALAMPHARLVVEVTATGTPSAQGADQVAILFSANPGSELAPLARAASGGELSRVRLALEVVLAAGSDGHTFVFDEVDAGVGGAVALEIGRRLAALARHAQVIVVTHLAQVAAFADRHYVVTKSQDGQVTTSGVAEVTGEDRLAELARMMGGLEGTQAARAHAAELLAEAAR